MGMMFVVISRIRVAPPIMFDFFPPGSTQLSTRTICAGAQELEAAKPQGLGQLAQGLMMLTTCRIILGSSQDQFRIIYKLYFILYKRLLGNNNNHYNNKGWASREIPPGTPNATKRPPGTVSRPEEGFQKARMARSNQKSAPVRPEFVDCRRFVFCPKQLVVPSASSNSQLSTCALAHCQFSWHSVCCARAGVATRRHPHSQIDRPA